MPCVHLARFSEVGLVVQISAHSRTHKCKYACIIAYLFILFKSKYYGCNKECNFFMYGKENNKILDELGKFE